MTILYQSNFDSATVGQLPSGWKNITGTWVVSTVSPVSAPNSFLSSSETDLDSVLCNGASTTADMGVQFDQVASGNPVDSGHAFPAIGAVLRADSAFANGYVAFFARTASGAAGTFDVLLFKRISGTYSLLSRENIAVQVASGDVLHSRFSINGTGINVYAWTNSNAPPASPSASFTDGSVTAAGYSGLLLALDQGSAAGVSIDNFQVDDAGGAPAQTSATAITLSGPTSGTVGQASANFTVGANGTLTGSVVVTPNDSSGGGTFSPTTVTINAGTPSATFTYTPASAGAKAIAVTNNGSLTNPAAETYTASASSGTVIQLPNDSVFLSPYNWDTLEAGTYGVQNACVQASACGAYLKAAFSGSTKFALNLDTSMYGSVPTGSLLLTARLDGGAVPDVTLPVQQSTALHTFFTGLATTAHHVEVWLSGSNEQVGTRWGADANTSPTSVVRIVSLSLDAGGVLAAPVVLDDFAMFDGDSITEGCHATGPAAEPQDHGKSYQWFIGEALKVERGVIGYGASGWTVGGWGNIPPFPTFWNQYSAGRPRDFTKKPKMVFVMHSQNDGSIPGVTTAAVAWLAQARAAFPQAWIFLLAPPSGVGQAQLQAAVAQYRNANPADLMVVFLDYRALCETGGFTGVFGGGATAQSIDGVHPLELENARFGAAIAKLALPYLNKTRWSGVGGQWI